MPPDGVPSPDQPRVRAAAHPLEPGPPRDGPRLALERVIAGFNRIDPDRLADRDLGRLRRDAVTIILRLLVLLAADARGLLPGDPTAALRAELEARLDAHDEVALLRAHAAWPRLLGHSDALPARGGPLFAVDRDPPIDDLTVLQLLRALPRAPDGEQIGATHEALLDHAVARVAATTLGLRGARGDAAASLVAGDLRVVASGERRSRGAHYTPRALCESIVRHTLEPLCHIGPAEGLPPRQWQRRPAAEILALRICDLAMGCGAFLLAACRYLAAQLLADDDERTHDLRERERHAKRLALRCLHGVDRDPLAVELARLALWLETASPDDPASACDATLRVGDALLGLVHAEQLEHLDLDPTRGRTRHADPELPRLLALRDHATLTTLADAITAAALRPRDPAARADIHTLAGALREPADPELRARVGARLGHDPSGAARQPLHWPLAFPEVFLRERPGFDAIVGNPPFQGGQKLSGALGPDYREHILVEHIARGRRGSADLCAYFFLRAAALLRAPGQLGLLATSTIAQGDTREVGLDQLVADGLEIVRASASAPWPGAARLAVAQVGLRRGPWAGERALGGARVAAIGPALTPAGAVPGQPRRLRAGAGRAFIGSYVLGLGFVLDPDEARALLARDPRNREVLCPYLNGDDLSRSVDQAPARWIINFRDWPLARAESYGDCLARVRERVKPQRDRVRFSPHARAHWWQYERPRAELYAAIARAPLVLACARVAKYLHFVRINRDLVVSEQIVVVTCDGPSTQAVLQSAAHEAWTLQHASTLDTRRRYTPSDCFETFPMPAATAGLAALADRHDAHRRAVLQATRLGLTRTYNRVHDPHDRDPALAALRDLHVELDRAVADAYGWSDLELGHGFHPTAQGPRFTIRAAARRELQERLLALNHARAAD